MPDGSAWPIVLSAPSAHQIGAVNSHPWVGFSCTGYKSHADEAFATWGDVNGNNAVAA